MAKNLDNVMLWKQACDIFKEDILPSIITNYELDGIKDVPARCEAWNNWTDSLCKDHIISDWQYNNWSYPYYL
jgi:hypothetical protein